MSPIQLLFIGPADSLPHIRSCLPSSIVVVHGEDERTVDARIGDCDAILDAHMSVHFPAARLENSPRLKLFVTATTGVDHVDADALAARGIPLLTLRGEREVLQDITAAAEHSWLLLMACARRLPAAFHDVLEGKWDRNRFPGPMLRGKTLGIVGVGRIGQWMARYSSSFGMSCLGFDPYVSPWPEGIECVDLETLLDRSDFVTLHVPLIEQTRGLIGRDQLARLCPHAILVNTSRGAVLDEAALLEALQERRLAAAGLDVLTNEPEVAHHPLVEYARTHDNLIITPHIGGFSPDALRHVLSFSCRRIARFFQD